jgi:DNA-binding transcriptional ArsR family regulator
MSIELALKAVAEPRRQAILRLLKNEGSQTPTDLGERLQITQQAASLHLKTLLDAGLVEARREGVRHVYALRPEGFQVVEAFLQEFWTDHLTALKREVEDDG